MYLGLSQQAQTVGEMIETLKDFFMYVLYVGTRYYSDASLLVHTVTILLVSTLPY